MIGAGGEGGQERPDTLVFGCNAARAEIRVNLCCGQPGLLDRSCVLGRARPATTSGAVSRLSREPISRSRACPDAEARRNSECIASWPHPAQTMDEALPRPDAIMMPDRCLGQGSVVVHVALQDAQAATSPVRAPNRRAKMADQMATSRTPSPTAAKGRSARREPDVVRDANRSADR